MPNENPQFRGNIPGYAAPDRADWAKRHPNASGQPYEIRDVPTKFLTRARAAVDRDSSTIEFSPAVNAYSQMDAINEAVGHAARIDLDEDLVFYDPQTDSFWAYPS
jgi:hypothetical protein